LSLKKLSKPRGKDNRILNDSESLGFLFYFDETILFDKIVEREKMLALSFFLNIKWAGLNPMRR